MFRRIVSSEGPLLKIMSEELDIKIGGGDRTESLTAIVEGEAPGPHLGIE